MAVIASAMMLLTVGASPALADDQHIVLYGDEGSDSNCFDKQVAIVIPDPISEDHYYVCFDYPP